MEHGNILCMWDSIDLAADWYVLLFSYVIYKQTYSAIQCSRQDSQFQLRPFPQFIYFKVNSRSIGVLLPDYFLLIHAHGLPLNSASIAYLLFLEPRVEEENFMLWRSSCSFMFVYLPVIVEPLFFGNFSLASMDGIIIIACFS